VVSVYTLVFGEYGEFSFLYLYQSFYSVQYTILLLFGQVGGKHRMRWDGWYMKRQTSGREGCYYFSFVIVIGFTIPKD